MYDYPSPEEVRYKVERRYRKRSLLLYHVILYVFIVSALFVIAEPSDDEHIVVAIVWAGLIVLHAARILSNELRDRAVEQELRRYFGDLPYKTKHGEHLALSEDGELVEMLDEGLHAAEIRKSSP
jgi:hypothetical protein